MRRPKRGEGKPADPGKSTEVPEAILLPPDVELVEEEVATVELLPDEAAAVPEAQPLPAPAALPAGPLTAAFQQARAALERWVDDEANRDRVLKADLPALRHEPALLAIIRPFEGYGKLVVSKLWGHLAFVVENRRKYYLAAPRQEP